MTPLWWMIGGSIGAWLIVTVTAPVPVNPELLWGMFGPLVSAVATWIVVVRAQRLWPERVIGTLVMLFAGKLIFFAAYMTTMLRGVGLRPAPFAAVFTTCFIGLYVMEALFLKRLFADGMRSSSSV
jgi:hypothetical protein